MSEKQQIIQNKIVNIFGEPWAWKSFFLTFIAYLYHSQYKSIIYSNFDIFLNWKKINRSLKSLEDIWNIGFQKRKGLVILDEAWKLLNSRESMRNIKEKSDVIDLAFLGRKFNIDVMIWAQLDFSIDKYYRSLAKYNFYMRSRFIKKDYLTFYYEVYTRGGRDNGGFVGEKEIDLFKFSKITKITYDTLDLSEITSEKADKWKKIQKIQKVEINDENLKDYNI